MGKFRVYGIYTATKLLGEFEADNAEQAEQLAADDANLSYVSLCHQCSNEIELDNPTPDSFVVEKAD